MSQKEKLLSRLFSEPNDFTYAELRALLNLLGYKEDNMGKTTGSAVRFINEKKHIIKLHRPHPGNTVKQYIIMMLIDELSKEGFIRE